MRAESLRQRLRTETRAAHEALEEDLPIARDRPDAVTYRDHLQFLLGFHEPMEKRLRNVAGLAAKIPDADRRWKTPALRADLGVFDTSRRAAAFDLPPIETASQAVGVVYVIEGATLGARTLLPRLRAAGVLPGPIGGRYVEAYGRQTAVMWKRFCGWLDGIESTRGDEVVDSARLTFDSLRSWRREWKRP